LVYQVEPVELRLDELDLILGHTPGDPTYLTIDNGANLWLENYGKLLDICKAQAAEIKGLDNKILRNFRRSIGLKINSNSKGIKKN
jgi:hypothetical protein